MLLGTVRQMERRCEWRPLAVVAVVARRAPLKRGRRRSLQWLGRAAGAATIVAIAIGASGAELTTVGETDVSLFQVEQDEFTDDLKYADLYLIADGREGSLLWACWHDHAQSEFDIRVNQRRAARRREKGDTERVRFRVDRHASWAETAAVLDIEADEFGGAWTSAVDFVASRRFVDQVVAGKRMIVQIADLGTVSYDLVTAKPDIVGFVRACERMRDDVWTEEDAAPTDESSPTHP